MILKKRLLIKILNNKGEPLIFYSNNAKADRSVFFIVDVDIDEEYNNDINSISHKQLNCSIESMRFYENWEVMKDLQL